MNYRNESLEQLIFDFLSMVDKATSLLEEKFGTRCILRLWRSNKIERCGTVVGYITYELHGFGCAVYFPDLCIDFDYGPDDRTDSEGKPSRWIRIELSARTIHGHPISETEFRRLMK